MTANKRIALNVVATYGRSLLGLVCGLFTGRWVLMSLGQVDYGLFGLVGGLTGFVLFFNDLLSNAISRFYAVSVGLARAEREAGLKDCQTWFNTALTIHTLLPLALVAIGYPAGIWAIRHFLSIPADRLVDCEWVWLFVCLTSFVNMVTVPFRAFYIAKQEIAELTLYGVAQTLLNFIFVYYMVTHAGRWLVKYSLWTSLISVAPNIILTVRAAICFEECRIKIPCLFIKKNFIELGKFAFYRFWGAGASMIQSQGLPILVNKYLGVVFNATMTVGTTVASQTLTLSQAMSGAIGPAIYNAYGARDRHDFESRVYQASKIGALLYLLFVIPAALEVQTLLNLWLKNPPPQSAVLCLFIMAAYLTERISDGEVNAIYADGRIAGFQASLCINCLIGFSASWLFVSLGWGIVGIAAGILLFKTLIMLCRVVYARRLTELSIRKWVVKVFMPIVIVSAVSIAVGLFSVLAFTASFARVCLTTLMVEVVFVPLVWVFVLSSSERKYVMKKVIQPIRTGIRMVIECIPFGHSFVTHYKDSLAKRAKKRAQKLLQENGWQVLSETHKMMMANHIDYYADFGTLLGFVREGAFIKHDDDLDFSIPPGAVDIKKLLYICLENGYEFVRSFSYNGVLTELSFIKHGISVDFFFTFPDVKDGVVSYVYDNFNIKDGRDVATTVKRFIKPKYTGIEVKTFRGVDVNIPSDFVSYLVYAYGESWKTPDRDYICKESPYRKYIDGTACIYRSVDEVLSF